MGHERKKNLLMAQTTHPASFGPVLVVSAAYVTYFKVKTYIYNKRMD